MFLLSNIIRRMSLEHDIKLHTVLSADTGNSQDSGSGTASEGGSGTPTVPTVSQFGDVKLPEVSGIYRGDPDDYKDEDDK